MALTMVTHLSREWWIVALRGAISILFGIVAFVYPGITLFALVIFFGAYLLVDGVVALVQATRFRHERERWPALLVEAVLGIVIGLISLVYPAIAALAWLYTIAAWAIVTGILEIVFAIRLRKEIQGEFWIALTGIASILFGIALAVLPLAGLVAWMWLIGAYAIAVGIFLIGLAIRLRREGSTASRSGLAAGGAR